MRKSFIVLIVGALLAWPPLAGANEFLLRATHSFGMLGLTKDQTMGAAVRDLVLFNPEFHLEYQIGGAWFLTSSFHYAYLRGKRGDNMNIYAPTGGIKIVSFEDTPLTGDFFDRTRWWLGVEAGLYLTKSQLTAVIPRGTQTDFGFNTAAGFDCFFQEHWAAGFQIKMHYVQYGPDDYILTAFGPHLLFRF